MKNILERIVAVYLLFFCVVILVALFILPCVFAFVYGLWWCLLFFVFIPPCIVGLSQLIEWAFLGGENDAKK
uniref:Uncharacterized protein n=1 Tax=virus sp. ctxZT69 TaxID=2826818 RepID=A0A8S5R6T9_9VIRU|nr:MAG TPA: hypothetical protein [virus sp. ctxZT69]